MRKLVYPAGKSIKWGSSEQRRDRIYVAVELAGVDNADFVCEMHKEGIGRVGTVCQTCFGDEMGCCVD
jgi:hypothetical protein